MLVVPSLAYAATLEARQHSLLPAWQWPWWLMVATWLLAHTFCLLHFCYFGGMQWQHVTLWVRHRGSSPGRQSTIQCCHWHDAGARDRSEAFVKSNHGSYIDPDIMLHDADESVPIRLLPPAATVACVCIPGTHAAYYLVGCQVCASACRALRLTPLSLSFAGAHHACPASR